MSADELFEHGAEVFQRVLCEMQSYGVEADPGMTLQKGEGLFCHYDLAQRAVFLSIPDASDPIGRFQAAVLRSMLGFESDDEMRGFVRLVLPRFLTHELGHHLRHRYGQFGDDLWHEEQVANHLATAIVKPRCSPADIRDALARLKPVIHALEKAGEGEELDAEASYHSAIHALRLRGHLDTSTLETLLAVGTALDADPADLLRASPLAVGAVGEHLRERGEAIGAFNAQYASDMRSYLRTHLRWMALDLQSPERQYVDDFARVHLKLRPPTLLPSRKAGGHDEGDDAREERGIVASFRAHRELARRSPVASRYFYRRYRALLLDHLARASGPRAHAGLDDSSLQHLLAVWNPSEINPLEFLRHRLPPALQALLPSSLAEDTTRDGAVPADLVHASDRRIWCHVQEGPADEGAATALRRIGILEDTDVFRGLPVDAMLDLCARLVVHKVAAGDVIVWQGALENDVGWLSLGEAEAVRGDEVIATLAPGSVFGELPFLTERPHDATIRARTDCECFVLRACELTLLGFENPSIFLAISRALARRLGTNDGCAQRAQGSS